MLWAGVRMSKRYSIFSLIENALTDHRKWGAAWGDANPQNEYDIIIVGGGGHGLATAYYLAKNHGIRNVAVLEKGWIGGGNTGRNTTIIRSNYLRKDSATIYELSRSLYENLSQDLNFNIMFSPRGVLMLCQTEHELRALTRTNYSNRVHGIETEMVGLRRIRELCPIINDSPNARYPILGGLWQPRAGSARHDAVAWGYARAAARLGVDIIQNCEVTGMVRTGSNITAVETSKGTIRCKKLGLVVAGNSGVLAEMAGFRLPIESVALQAAVSEPIKPCMDIIVMANTVHGYLSQSDKGEMVIGGGTDSCINYSQRGSFHHLEETIRALVETFPIISRLKMLRQWAGVIDVTGDRSPIISRTPVDNVFVNCGWGTGGFKATPGSGHCFAATLARGEPDDVAAPFGLSRFREGRMIDESVAAAVAH